ncbi:MAG TPA: sn-glycerol-1-phosphate dehydrogenase [Methylomirabilota bacterium]|nr:sn-glycerol-1-phosphate dehydrogenase [Methylomirabilota bacterium]
MSVDTLRALLAGRCPDPDGPGMLAVPTRSVVIAPGLARDAGSLVGALGLGRRLAVVSDAITHEVLGAAIARAVASIAEVILAVLPAGVHGDAAAVEDVRGATRRADGLIAVGSGTLNDLCKYAAALDRKPYAVFGTAPSMNGYTSVSAAITVDGLKRSLPAVAARGVFLDVDVLARAPARLIRAGLGDSLCRPTAQADWLLAHLLHDQPYREAPFALLAEEEDALLDAPEALIARDPEAIARLARVLVLSGFGMTICGGSYPASQGEHLISHYADMRPPPGAPASYHGEQIGVTTLTMARLQERVLAGPAPRLGPVGVDDAALVRHFGAELGRSCWVEFAPKRVDPGSAERVNARLASAWEGWRRRLAAVGRPAARLADVLRRAGAPTEPEALGWPRPYYRDAVIHARLIRNRYTFLDLAADAGMLEAFAAGL